MASESMRKLVICLILLFNRLLVKVSSVLKQLPMKKCSQKQMQPQFKNHEKWISVGDVIDFGGGEF